MKDSQYHHIVLLLALILALNNGIWFWWVVATIHTLAMVISLILEHKKEGLTAP